MTLNDVIDTHGMHHPPLKCIHCGKTPTQIEVGHGNPFDAAHDFEVGEYKREPYTPTTGPNWQTYGDFHNLSDSLTPYERREAVRFLNDY